ncbi:hypothetical protein [Emticicia sp. BO119]|uniref:hypothetical protein n=1 Tax=Emticicia sp. BO119 TaxID=2757768 RepID=UPI0017CC3E66|nr:hypothetical protein [Emticicia sp. BO119]MBA4852399.1 hypothetical protein [Emticicia sp. BO119]
MNEINSLKASDIKQLLLKIYIQYKKGEITHSVAYKESFLLNSILKAIQITDLQKKLETIESILHKNEEYK